MFMGLFLIAVYLVFMVVTFIWITDFDPVDSGFLSIAFVLFPPSAAVYFWVKALKSEPLELYTPKYKVGQKIKFNYSRYWDYLTRYQTDGDVFLILKIEMIDKLNGIYYTDKGKLSFWEMHDFGFPLKTTWVVTPRKEYRERR